MRGAATVAAEDGQVNADTKLLDKTGRQAVPIDQEHRFNEDSMPVNRKPKNRVRPSEPTESAPPPAPPKNADEPTEADLAQKEWEDLWEENEPIDMDKW